MQGLCLNHDLTDKSRRLAVFGGDLLLYSCRPSTAALCDHARDMVKAALLPHEAETAQFALTVTEFVNRVGPLKTRFTNDTRTKELVRDVLVDFGCDLRRTYFDVPRLRVVPSGDYLSSGVSYAYKAHRDIWYSSPLCQINFWMPVFTIVPGRAMSFFPAYWSRPVSNSSHSFDYGEWCAVGRRQALTQVAEDTRKHPLPLEPVDLSSEIRIAGTKGDSVLFSAAHLHATAPNQSGLTRFSIDFRTINIEDLETGAGSPNIDSRATGTTIGDFLRADDFSPIERTMFHVA